VRSCGLEGRITTNGQTPVDAPISRRALLQAGALLGVGALSGCDRRAEVTADTADELFGELDAKIEAGMAHYHVPGAAVGVFHQGREHVRGYGVTNVDHPRPVDGNTLFRIASTTKTFTGAVIMRLAEQQKLDLSATVCSYLPDFRVADPLASQRVTLRQCLNHSAGWLGDDETDFGQGEDALAKFVASLATLPQLSPPGTQFAYNNVALDVVGRVIEVVTGQPYEDTVRELLLEPLGLDGTRFTVDQLAGQAIAGSHTVVEGRATFAPDDWYLPRNAYPDGGLISNAHDQLRYARFLMGDGRGADGTPVLQPESLLAMRSDPGPGGTLIAEIDGYGVTLCVRRSAEGVTIVEHGGDYQGQHSGFLLVPERDFAMTLLTNSSGGTPLKVELFYDDWALQRFAGLHNPPAEPVRLTATQLAQYEGSYVAESIDQSGTMQRTAMTAAGRDGQLRWSGEGGPESTQTLTFYRDDHVLVAGQDLGPPGAIRANFVRGHDGRIVWYSFGGRLHRRQV
jgi:CubicO group peptidase (beta-lactamase class C family)